MKNKRIIITGASRGLGAVAAVAFAERGARIALLARSGENLDNVRHSCSEPRQHLSVPVDLLVPKEIQSAVEKAREFLGGIDVVLHAAGGGLGLKDEFLTHDDLLKLFSLNLGAAAEINRLVAP